MANDKERTETWTFLEPGRGELRALVVLIEFPDLPGRPMFVGGQADDGRSIKLKDGEYICNDGTILVLRQ